MDEELERFKREINLAELAASYGYVLVGRPGASTKMRHGEDIIIIATAPDGHGIYFGVQGEKHNDRGGSVVDFAMNEHGIRNLGQGRKILREYTGSQYHFSFPAAPRIPKPPPITHDRAGVIAKWERMPPYRPGYLEGRKLSPSTIALFGGHIRTDERGNACFLHEDETGVTGFEVKNKGFTGFAPGGEKGLFMCRVGEARDTEEQRIIIAESAIDVMSCYQLNPSDGIYISIGGGLSKKQPEQLRRVLAQYPHARIFIATDNDLPTPEKPVPEGEHYHEVISKLRPPTATVVRARPPEPYKDWNDRLTGRPRQPKHSHAQSIMTARSSAKEPEHQH